MGTPDGIWYKRSPVAQFHQPSQNEPSPFDERNYSWVQVVGSITPIGYSMNLVVVYSTAFNTVDTVLEYLKRHGYDAVALETPSSDRPRTVDSSRHTIRDFVNPMAYVAVPSEQEKAARLALSSFKLPSYRRIAAIGETILFQILVASLVTFVVAILLILNNPFDIYFPILYAVWLGAFIFTANLGRVDSVLTRQRIFHMWRKPPVD
jgi:hypothetical protein